MSDAVRKKMTWTGQSWADSSVVDDDGNDGAGRTAHPFTNEDQEEQSPSQLQPVQPAVLGSMPAATAHPLSMDTQDQDALDDDNYDDCFGGDVDDVHLMEASFRAQVNPFVASGYPAEDDGTDDSSGGAGTAHMQPSITEVGPEPGRVLRLAQHFDSPVASGLSTPKIGGVGSSSMVSRAPDAAVSANSGSPAAGDNSLGDKLRTALSGNSRDLMRAARSSSSGSDDGVAAAAGEGGQQDGQLLPGNDASMRQGQLYQQQAARQVQDTQAQVARSAANTLTKQQAHTRQPKQTATELPATASADTQASTSPSKSPKKSNPSQPSVLIAKPAGVVSPTVSPLVSRESPRVTRDSPLVSRETPALVGRDSPIFNRDSPRVTRDSPLVSRESPFISRNSGSYNMLGYSPRATGDSITELPTEIKHEVLGFGSSTPKGASFVKPVNTGSGFGGGQKVPGSILAATSPRGKGPSTAESAFDKPEAKGKAAADKDSKDKQKEKGETRGVAAAPRGDVAAAAAAGSSSTATAGGSAGGSGGQGLSSRLVKQKGEGSKEQPADTKSSKGKASEEGSARRQSVPGSGTPAASSTAAPGAGATGSKAPTVAAKKPVKAASGKKLPTSSKK